MRVTIVIVTGIRAFVLLPWLQAEGADEHVPRAVGVR